MIPPGNTLATRGILNNNNGVVIPTAGFLILNVQVAPVIRKKHGGMVGVPLGYPEPKTPNKKYYIKVTFKIGDQVYTDIKYINKDVKISMKDINIDIENNKPKVKIKFENDIDVEEIGNDGANDGANDGINEGVNEGVK